MITESAKDSLRLSDDALCLLQDRYRERWSSLTKTAEDALLAILRCLEDLLTANPPPTRQYFLSSVDPGVGKTEAVCMFLKAWKAKGFKPTGGVLVAVSRHDEIEAFIERSGLTDDDFAVLVAQGAQVSSRGLRDHGSAPVLFTTHEMIRRRSRGGAEFAHLDCFHYRSRPRSCRVWDEAMLPAQPVNLRLDAIKGLLEHLRPAAPEVAVIVDGLIGQVAQAEVGDIIRVPLLARRIARPEAVFNGQMAERWAKLVELAGRQVTVMSSNLHGLELVACVDQLPEDFAPAVILDASARLRHTYRVWERTSGNIVRLPAAITDYRPLVIHHWDRSASRSTFYDSKTRSNVLSGVAALIEAERDRKWLVIHHVPRGDLDMPTELLKLISSHEAKVQFCHWGAHHGTNAYRQADRVVVLGLWHFSPATYQALYQASGCSQPSLVDGQEVAPLQAGEHCHNLLQAVCRASVRNGSDGICGHCTVYVIGRIDADTKGHLQTTFPGATVRDWSPSIRPLRGKALQVINIMEAEFADPEAASVQKKVLTMRAGFSRSQELAQVLRRADVKRWMLERGLTTTTRTITRRAA